uniref:Uncharacterized protein n=1 Tax=Arundo donax TaxID=35708 RepID=A0A0A9ET07_ARUDO
MHWFAFIISNFQCHFLALTSTSPTPPLRQGQAQGTQGAATTGSVGRGGTGGRQGEVCMQGRKVGRR